MSSEASRARAAAGALGPLRCGQDHAGAPFRGQRHADATFSISVTTRAPRGAERDGVDYHFVTPGALRGAGRRTGALAEWAEVHGRRYGTLRATVDRSLAAGQVAVFDIDVQGGAQLRRPTRRRR